MAQDTQALCLSLVSAIDLAVDNNGTCLMAFHDNAPPDILHHSMDVATARHYLDRYLAGPYLLDPLYPNGNQDAAGDRLPISRRNSRPFPIE